MASQMVMLAVVSALAGQSVARTVPKMAATYSATIKAVTTQVPPPNLNGKLFVGAHAPDVGNAPSFPHRVVWVQNVSNKTVTTIRSSDNSTDRYGKYFQATQDRVTDAFASCSYYPGTIFGTTVVPTFMSAPDLFWQTAQFEAFIDCPVGKPVRCSQWRSGGGVDSDSTLLVTDPGGVPVLVSAKVYEQPFGSHTVNYTFLDYDPSFTDEWERPNEVFSPPSFCLPFEGVSLQVPNSTYSMTVTTEGEDDDDAGGYLSVNVVAGVRVYNPGYVHPMHCRNDYIGIGEGNVSTYIGLQDKNGNCSSQRFTTLHGHINFCAPFCQGVLGDKWCALPEYYSGTPFYGYQACPDSPNDRCVVFASRNGARNRGSGLMVDEKSNIPVRMLSFLGGDSIISGWKTIEDSWDSPNPAFAIPAYCKQQK